MAGSIAHTRQRRRGTLSAAVRKVFDDSGGSYGSPRVGDQLREQGWQVSDNTIAQLMAEHGLVARAKRRRRGLTRQGKRPAAPDLIKRRFTAPAPDVAGCGDMTEIVTGEGKLYLATVIDLYSRRVLGSAMGAHHDAGLVVAALTMAAVTRGGDVAGVIFHSDRGSEYASAGFARACARWRVRRSMGRVGSCFDCETGGRRQAARLLLTTDPAVSGVLAVDLSSGWPVHHLVVLAGRAVTS